MAVTQDGKTVRVAVGYSAKVPVAPDNSNDYSMHDSHVSISIEETFADDTDIEKVIAEFEELEAELTTAVKLAVFTNLGLEANEIADGVLIPQVQVAAKPARKRSSGGGRKRSSNGGRRSSGRSGRRRRSGGNDKFADLDRYEIDGSTFIDVRPLKESGEYSPNAADFREERGNRALWIEDKNGNLNEDTADLLDEAGVEY